MESFPGRVGWRGGCRLPGRGAANRHRRSGRTQRTQSWRIATKRHKNAQRRFSFCVFSRLFVARIHVSFSVFSGPEGEEKKPDADDQPRRLRARRRMTPEKPPAAKSQPPEQSCRKPGSELRVPARLIKYSIRIWRAIAKGFCDSANDYQKSFTIQAFTVINFGT